MNTFEQQFAQATAGYLKAEDIIQEMPLPMDWDLNVFQFEDEYTRKNFTRALKYAKKYSKKYWGKGSSRAAFEVQYKGHPTIIKIAMNPAGLDQNTEDVKVLFGAETKDNPLIIPGIDYDTVNDRPLWIHQELADAVTENRFRRETGMDTSELIYFMRRIYDYYQGDITQAINDYKANHTEIIVGNMSLVRNLYKLWEYLGFEREFLADLNGPRNWGQFQGRLVILDVGYTSNVSRRHYGGRTTSSPWLGPPTDSIGL